MMDNRIYAIKKLLRENRYESKASVLSYSVKFASSFYGPFRYTYYTNGSTSKGRIPKGQMAKRPNGQKAKFQKAEYPKGQMVQKAEFPRGRMGK